MTIGVSGRPLSASQASTDSPWWSSPQATISPGASASSSATASTTASQHVLGVLLHPARARVVRAASRAAPRARGRRSASNSDRLDGRGALVDAEQQAHRSPRARYSAVRRHQGPPPAALGPARAAARARARTPSSATIAHTRSAIPSEAVRPVERIAATFTRRAHARDGADQVVDAAARRTQAGVGGDRLGALERRVHGGRLRQDLVARLGTHRPVVLVLLVDRRRARRRPCRRSVGNTSTPLVRLVGTGSRIRSSGSPPRRVEHEELALARIDRRTSRRRRAARPRPRRGRRS